MPLGYPVEGFGTGGISFGTEPGDLLRHGHRSGPHLRRGRGRAWPTTTSCCRPSTPDGAPDATFADAGHLVWNQNLTDVILDLEVDAEGSIVASGTSGQPGFFGDRDFACIRLLPDGTPDPDFGTGGITTTSFGTAFDDANGMVDHPRQQGRLRGHERPDQQRLRHRPLLPRARHQ